MRLLQPIICLQHCWTIISSRAMHWSIDPRQVVWKRCVDMNDRVLRNIVVGLGNKMDGMVREDHFVITVASEIMAILCLADDIAGSESNVWNALSLHIILQGDPVTADDLTGNRSNDSTFKRCDQTKSDPDAGAYTGAWSTAVRLPILPTDVTVCVQQRWH